MPSAASRSTRRTPLADPIVDLDLELPAGRSELDSSTALGYVRTRVDEDYGRMRRQQEVISRTGRSALTDPDAAASTSSLLLDGLDSLADRSAARPARRAARARPSRRARREVTNFIIEPPLITFEGDRDDGRGYVLEADFEAIRAGVQALIGG